MSYCATYCRHGAGRSINARIAEGEGKRPLTRAIPEVAEALGVTRAQARNLILYVGACEWHHVSKYANEVNYYDVAEAVRWLSPDVVHAEAMAENVEVENGRYAEAMAEDRMRFPTAAGIEADHAEAIVVDAHAEALAANRRYDHCLYKVQTAPYEARRRRERADRHAAWAKTIRENAAYYVAYHDATSRMTGAARKARRCNLSKWLHVGKEAVAAKIEALRETLSKEAVA